MRVKVGTKLVMVWSGKTSISLGRSTVHASACDGEVPLDVVRSQCFAHAGGFIVRATLHWSCGGDQHVDRIGWIATW